MKIRHDQVESFMEWLKPHRDHKRGSSQGAATASLGNRFMPSEPEVAITVAWIVTPLSPFGGTATHLRQWATGLEGEKIVPVLLYFSPEEADGATFDLPNHLLRRSLPELNLHRRNALAAVLALAAAIQQFNADVLHSLYIGSDLLTAMLSFITGKPALSSLEGELFVPHLKVPWNYILPPAYSILARRFSMLTAISTATAGAARPYVPSRLPITVVYPGVLENKPRPVPDCPPRLLWMGRMAPVKRLPLLLESFRLLLHWLPDVELVLAGDGPGRKVVELLLVQWELHPYVQLTGWLSKDDAQKQLERCHLLLLSSRSEGMPWVALEAMSRGVPVVSTAVGGLPELIQEQPEHERNGYLVNIAEPAAFALTLFSLLNRSDWRGELARVGLKAQETLRTRFRLDQEIGSFIRIYQTLHAGSK